MLQDLDTTIQKFAEQQREDQTAVIPKLYEIIIKYGNEIMHDLQSKDPWQAGLHTGYILCLMGQTNEGEAFLERSWELYKKTKSKYSAPESSILMAIVNTLEEFGANQNAIKHYKTALETARNAEAEKPEDLRRKIAHLEADMECLTGDLAEGCASVIRHQGLAYQKLGEHEKAIQHFQRSTLEHEGRREENFVQNKLSIIDSYIATRDRLSAQNELVSLIKALVPDNLKLGDKLPDKFTETFEKLHPYLKKLGGNLENIATYAQARLKKIKPKEHWDRVEILQLSRLLGLYHVGRGEYQQASDVYDAGRKRLEYKRHLSRRDQAEFAILAGNPTKAKELLAEDQAEEDTAGMGDEPHLEWANVYLQLGEVQPVLDLLDKYCEDYKKGLLQGTYGRVLETRRTQIQILKAVLGNNWYENVRTYAQDKPHVFPDKNLKHLNKEDFNIHGRKTD